MTFPQYKPTQSRGGCACGQVLGFLASIGCQHAARMHATPLSGWTPTDWIIHMFEEEKNLFPLLKSSDVKRLMDDHAVFRKEIHVYGEILNTELITEHSNLEDELVKQLLRERSAG